MKIFVVLALFVLWFIGCNREVGYEPRNGDIIFQTSQSPQSVAIQKATKSRYSHMGIVFVENGQARVFEAVEPVKTTPLHEWISRGKNEHFVVKRLKRADELLTNESLERMKVIGKTKFLNLHYDKYFQWSDERIYCSELVWKVFKEAVGVEIGKLGTLGGFDLSDPVVQKLMFERFGGPVPEGEPVIAPVTMYESELLETVYEN